MTGVERVALIAAVLVGGVLLVSGGARLFDRRVTRADGTTALVDEATGSTVEVNVLGGLVWQCLDGVSTLEAVVDDLGGVAAGPSDPAPIP